MCVDATNSSSDDSLDEALAQLALRAKQYPERSPERIKAITRLLMVVENANKWHCKTQLSHPKELYHEALQSVRFYVFEHIEACNPTRVSVLSWLNQTLDAAFEDAIAQHLESQQNPAVLEISWEDHRSDGWQEDDCLLDAARSMMGRPLLSARIRQIIEDDPDNIFKQKHVRGRPEVNFRAIALKTFDGFSRREIASEWGLQEQTLYSFFSRACKTFKPLFDQYLRD